MPTGKITRNTYIAGEPVAVDDVVEVDETTFNTLLRCGKIERHRPDATEDKKAPAPPKFKKVDKPKAD